MVASKTSHIALLIWVIICGSSGYDGQKPRRLHSLLAFYSIFDLILLFILLFLLVHLFICVSLGLSGLFRLWLWVLVLSYSDFFHFFISTLETAHSINIAGSYLPTFCSCFFVLIVVFFLFVSQLLPMLFPYIFVCFQGICYIEFYLLNT